MKSTFTFVIAIIFTLNLSAQAFTNRQNWPDHPTSKDVYELINEKMDHQPGIQLISERNYLPILIPEKYSSKEIKQKLDSIVGQTTFMPSKEWTNSYKEEFFYDENLNNSLVNDYFWNETNGQWDNYWMDEYTYDEDGKPLSVINYIWDMMNSEWNSWLKSEYTYDGNGLLILNLRYRWDLIAEEWKLDYKLEHTYDNNERPDEIIFSEFIDASAEWIYEWKNEYVYDSKNAESAVIGYEWDGMSQWINDWKTEYSYNNEDKLIQYIDYDWDNFNSQWVNDEKSEYTYNANNDVEEYIHFDWIVSKEGWEPTYKGLYEYNTSGDVFTFTSLDWVGLTSTWLPAYREEYQHNNDYMYTDLILPIYYQDYYDYYSSHMLITITRQSWNENSSTWEDDYERTYSYSEENTWISENQVGIINVYPIPADDYIIFGLENISNNYFVEIFDIQGKQVVTEELNIDNKVSIDRLKEGLYFYRITEKDNFFTGKIIVE